MPEHLNRGIVVKYYLGQLTSLNSLLFCTCWRTVEVGEDCKPKNQVYGDYKSTSDAGILAGSMLGIMALTCLSKPQQFVRQCRTMADDKEANAES